MKCFVLDTNVLIYDPESIKRFPRHEVVIPVTVLEELDRLKRLPSDTGKSSRAAIRLLDSLRSSGEGDLHSGIRLENDSLIRIEVEIKEDPKLNISLSKEDNRILMVAAHLASKGKKVVFVSKDFAARLKAEALGLEARDYEHFKVAYDRIYSGLQTVTVDHGTIASFLKEGLHKPTTPFHPNEYCFLSAHPQAETLTRYDVNKQGLVPLANSHQVWGIKARNLEQRCAIDLLLRDDVHLVTLVGQAGTGKTLLALACGLQKVFQEGSYSRILVSRPIVPLGRDIGYLPGTKEEKLFHWMQPIYDNLEFLCSAAGKGIHETLRSILDSKKIEMEAVTYIRGRTLPNVFMVIDEAQNLTPHEIKTIISRAGEGTKVILCGDPTQIDNPYLDQNSCGLTFTVGCFQGESIYGHLFLRKTERSPLAALAAKIM